MGKNWWKSDASGIPAIRIEPPGPKSEAMHRKTINHMRGLSGQVKLFPVCFDRGYGITLTDVDGNKYLDFSSGIYVTSLGHCHPKITEAVSRWAGRLMNAHDFTTPVKEALMEKMADVLPGDLSAFQLYSDGSSAVEAGIRAARAITGKHEFLSCFRDFHGKTMAAVSCAQMARGDVLSYGPFRAPGFYMLPRPNPYRPLFTTADGTVDTDRYLQFYDEFIREGTAGNAAAFVLEPVQGWGGSIFPPDDFFPKLRSFCDQREILLIDDEVLAGMGRTGTWLAADHYGVVPDIVTLGKSFGNGFPVTAIAVREEYAPALDQISASSSYGGNPMACAAALASIEVIEQENLLENAARVGDWLMKRMLAMKEAHPIIGNVTGKGMLFGIELVTDKQTKTPFDEAGKLVYQKAFKKGLAWIPAGHILRMSPPIIMDEHYAGLGLDIIEEAIDETEQAFGYP